MTRPSGREGEPPLASPGPSFPARARRPTRVGLAPRPMAPGGGLAGMTRPTDTAAPGAGTAPWQQRDPRGQRSRSGGIRALDSNSG